MSSVIRSCYRNASTTIVSPYSYTQGAINVVSSGTTYSDVPILRAADSSVVKSVKVGSNVSYLSTEITPTLSYTGSVYCYNEYWEEGGDTCSSSTESYSEDYIQYSLTSLTADSLGANESITISVLDETPLAIVYKYRSYYYYYPTSLYLLCKIYHASTSTITGAYKIPIYRRTKPAYSPPATKPADIVLTASSPATSELYVLTHSVVLADTNTLYLSLRGSVICNYTKPISGTSASCTISPTLSYADMDYIASFSCPSSNSKTSTYSSSGYFKTVTYLAGDY